MTEQTPRLLAAFYIGDGDSWYTRLAIPIIRFWDRSPITHCELVIDYGDNQYWFTSEPKRGVSVCRNPDRILENWIFLDLEADQLQVREVAEFFSELFDSGYDWIGIIFSLIIPFRWESRSNWFCSEICRAAINSVGIHIPGYNRAKDYQVTPAQLYNELRGSYRKTFLDVSH